MKKVIMESLLVFTMLVFMVSSSAMAAKPEDVTDNSNVLPSGKNYALNITGTSGKNKEAITITELQTDDPCTSTFDGDDAAMEQLRMIMFLMLVHHDPDKLYQ